MPSIGIHTHPLFTLGKAPTRRFQSVIRPSPGGPHFIAFSLVS